MYKNSTKENRVTLVSCLSMVLCWLLLSILGFGNTGNKVPASGGSGNPGTLSLRMAMLGSTIRTVPQGYFRAVVTSTYSGADDAHHINDYVKRYVDTDNRGFTFPVDSGIRLRILNRGSVITYGISIATAWMGGDPGTVTDPTDIISNNFNGTLKAWVT